MLLLLAPKVVEQAEKDLGQPEENGEMAKGQGGQNGKFKVNANVKGTVNAPDAASALKQAGGQAGPGGAAGRQSAGGNRKRQAGNRAAG